MTSVDNTPVSYLGIDVSKETLDLAVDGQEGVWTFANDAAGIAQLIERIRPLRPRLIVVEATGGYERAVLNAILAPIGALGLCPAATGFRSQSGTE